MNNFFVAIIPARSGSKSIKNKNMALVNNKPMIHWSIVEALKSNHIKEILITTNCSKVKNYCTKIFKNKKINLISRPSYLSKDNTKMLPVVNHAKYFSKYYDDKKLLGFILLQPTSPLRKKKDIDEACKLFEKNKPDSLVSILRLKHIYNPESLYFFKKKILKKVFKIKNSFLKQKKKSYYTPNGAAIYITNKKKIDKFIVGGKKIIGFLMPYSRSIDVDNKEDLKLANILFKKNV
jgi:hypothetical protein